ncbi:MAG: biotin--[acetyl-CoA-carboxylase] ligase [Ignavibacteriae bacterium]|nr:biotin--[acetyl-CoA-carboxylase] ligase [Ignavibacteriota bacterium]
MFTERALRTGLNTRIFGNKIYTFESIDSTNNCAKAVAGCGAAEGTVVIAEEQTAGRGRLGRVWRAAPNENLLFSLVVRPKLGPEAINLFPLYAAVGVAQAVEKMTGLKIECKWPNDLLINRKKFAGILIEGSLKQNNVEYVVLGVGINVNQQKFEGELAGKATSLRIESRREIDRVKLFREILKALEDHYTSVTTSGFQSILPEWLSRTKMINKTISVSHQGTVFSGVVKGLSNEGGLVLQSNGSVKTLYAGDVTVVGT